MDFYIGQTFEASYPPEAALWCAKNGAYIKAASEEGDSFVIVGIPDVTLEEVKRRKLEEINGKYNVATSSLVETYPATELLTFDQQEAEARAWEADNSAETPLVDMLAVGRQIDKAELVRRIIIKSDAFKLAAGYLTGQRQRYEDLLGGAQTVEDVEAIVPEYVMPTGLDL